MLLSCRAAADVRAFSNYVISAVAVRSTCSPQLPGADPARVAAVGFSFGSAVTGALAGVDHRLRGAVIQSGRAHLSTAIGVACRRLGARKLKAYVRAYSVIDPVHYVTTAAPVSLLFQNGTRDPGFPGEGRRRLLPCGQRTKERRSYDAPHELDAQALADRDAWLVKLLLG